jgi:nucleoid-associated protein YgaU
MATTIDPLLYSVQLPLAQSTPRSRTSVSRTSVSARPSVSARTFQRRRRTVAALFVFGVASFVITSGAFASNPGATESVAPRSVVAKSGDTLWDIARTVVPQGDISDLVSELVRMNGSRIEPGQVIRIP